MREVVAKRFVSIVIYSPDIIDEKGSNIFQQNARRNQRRLSGCILLLISPAASISSVFLTGGA
jgi:hypothetical protein